MSKADDFLKLLQSNLGKWICAYCGSNSGQPAAIFREIKKQGYLFEEISPNHWANTMYCDKCKDKRTHYKLLNANPQFESKKRINIGANRGRILALLNYRDAFTGASITSTPEIDHKVPWTRLEQDIDTFKLSDRQIKEHFQLLTREHNLLKDRMCSKCKESNIRPPFLEISFWWNGDNHYNGTCEGCGWYDGEAWRKAINIKISKTE